MANVIYHPGNSNLSGPGIGISGPGPSSGGTTPNNSSSVIGPGAVSGFGSPEKDEVILNPNAPMDYSQLNSMFEKLIESIGGYGSNAEAYSDTMHDMFEDYKDYNDQMWNRAKEYDEYMSNTAIQRQVEDLKKAGLNPILASHLAGASYNGVSPSYAQINPAQAFGSMLGLEGTKYSSDSSRNSAYEVAQLHTSSSEFITQYNRMYDAILQNDEHTFLAGMVELKKSADEYLENLKYSNEYDLKMLGFENEAVLLNKRDQLNREFNNWFYSDDSNYYKWINKEKLWRFFGDVVSSAIAAGARVYSS